MVEDDSLIADALRRELEARDARVLGQVPDVAGALALPGHEGRSDLAVPDVNLGDELAYPVADRLRAQGVPFVFATGCDASAIDEAHRDVPRCEKPGDVAGDLAALADQRDG